jgi:RNA-binding protein
MPTPAPRLTGAQKSHLRSLAQTLEPKVFVGKEGATPALAGQLEAAFRKADLVKVRFTAGRAEMAEQAAALAAATGCALVGAVGRTAAFYRKGGEEAGE